MDFIRKLGNNAAHNGKKITLDEARLCLENLYIFLDFVAYCYGEQYVETKFNPELLDKMDSFEERQASQSSEIDLKALIEENKALRAQLTARREEQQQTYVPNLWICLNIKQEKYT